MEKDEVVSWFLKHVFYMEDLDEWIYSAHLQDSYKTLFGKKMYQIKFDVWAYPPKIKGFNPRDYELTEDDLRRQKLEDKYRYLVTYVTFQLNRIPEGEIHFVWMKKMLEIYKALRKPNYPITITQDDNSYDL
jgi:hypothetical protein